eukprot:TRINITY_DN51191_c0_g1_i1.p1 TRINITY_DN51191_c0_g1~~TRINITY_DN51191_c0_g1_i1.p1  ORF type:complete len:120 (-),score=5.24 TRINITY_DN51191_c0_g1_i1:8-367(-)
MKTHASNQHAGIQSPNSRFSTDAPTPFCDVDASYFSMTALIPDKPLPKEPNLDIRNRWTSALPPPCSTGPSPKQVDVAYAKLPCPSTASVGAAQNTASKQESRACFSRVVRRIRERIFL